MSKSRNTFTLRGYQAAMVDGAIGTLRKRHLLVESPTGSGKTTMALAIMASLLRRSFTHTLVVAPQCQIEAGFVDSPPSTIAWPARSGRSPVDVAAGFISRARHGDASSSAREIVNYLRDPRPRRALATTHSAFRHAVEKYADEIPADLRKCLLVVDEAHHVSPENKIGRAVGRWDEHGGRLLYLTATPFSGDDRVVLRDGMEHVRRTYPEHIEGGRYAPRLVEHRVLTFGSRVVEDQFLGIKAPKDSKVIARLVRKVVATWLADGRPKVMVHVPPANARGGSRPLIEALKAGFARVKGGPVVFDASGEARSIQHGFNDLLAAERRAMKAGEASGVDVIIGCQRLPEGTDWPWCSHVYTVGIPGSLGRVLQLFGRSTRQKPQGYDARHRDTASITFFVPSEGGKALDALSVECSRHSLMMVVQMVDYAAAEAWIVTRAVRKALGGDQDAPEVDVHADHGLDPETYARAKLVMAAEVDENDRATIGDLVAAVRGQMPDVPAEAVNAIAAAVLAGSSLNGNDSVAGSVAAGIKRFLEVKPDIRWAMREAFTALVEEYRDATLGDCRSLRLIKEQVVRLDGKSLREWTERVRGALFPWTEEFIRAKAEEWKAANGRYPNALSGAIPGTTTTWSTAAGWLAARGSSLPSLFSGKPRARRRVYVFEGETCTPKSLAERAGCSLANMHSRLHNMTPEEAVAIGADGANRYHDYRGERRTTKQLAASAGCGHGVMRLRLRRMTPEEAVALGADGATRYHDYRGDEFTASQLAERSGCSRSAMRRRLQAMTPEEAVALGANGNSKRHDYHGEQLTTSQLAERAGCCIATMQGRLRVMPPGEAVALGGQIRPAATHRPGDRPQPGNISP